MGVYIPNMEKPKSCWECFNAVCNHWGEHGYDNTADCPLIEIVQCKDCKWSYIDEKYEGTMWCKVHFHDYRVTDDGFCNYGERRTDGDI